MSSPIHKLHQQRLEGSITTTAIVESVIERTKKIQPQINAYLLIEKADKMLQKAAEVDLQIQKSQHVSPLAGMPIGLKDIFVTKNLETTCASKILKGFIPPYESTVSQKLLDSNYNLTGKLNLDEFAMGASNENSAFGAVHNPWDLERVPGGSSGGAAAAVASSLCLAALGTDTGGSIRQPASYTNTVGMKPTYGRVSRYGMIAFASSLDQAGPITQDISDCALLLQTIAGYDSKDSTSLKIDSPAFYDNLKAQMPKKIGIIKNISLANFDDEIRENFEKVLNFIQNEGVEIVSLDIPLIDYTVAIYYILACSEASSNLGRYDGIRYGARVKGDNLEELYKNTRNSGFGEEVKLRILTGTFALSTGYYDAYYNKANQARKVITKNIIEQSKEIDFIMTPVTTTLPFLIGEPQVDPLKLYLLDQITIPANLGGFPAISIPAGFSKQNLPIGIQFMGKHLDEQNLLNYSLWFEKIFKFEKPKLPI